jgi:hypothetical protein
VTNQTALWLQEIQAVGAVATTIGVLIALYVAVVREPRKAAEERRHHEAQMDALRRAHGKRVAAQARKVFPSCVRTPMFGDSWWSVRIDNAGNAATTILAVEVIAIDANGIEVPDGCRPAHNTMPVDQAFDWSIRAALSAYSQPRSGQLPSAFKQALANRAAQSAHRDGLHDREPRLHAARHDRLRRQNRISMAAHRHRPTETHVAGLAAGHIIQRRLLQFG